MMILQIWRHHNQLSRRIALKLRDRIAQRWEMSAGVFYYLHYGTSKDDLPAFDITITDNLNYDSVCFFENYDPSDNLDMDEHELLSVFEILSKPCVKAFILSLLNRHCHEEVLDASESVPDMPITAAPSDAPKSFKELLQLEVKKCEQSAQEILPQESTLGRIITAIIRGIFPRKSVYNATEHFTLICGVGVGDIF